MSVIGFKISFPCRLALGIKKNKHCAKCHGVVDVVLLEPVCLTGLYVYLTNRLQMTWNEKKAF